MEIISICICNKDDSILDFYPNEMFQVELELSEFESFTSWAVANADSAGYVELDRSSYDTAVELLGTDDLGCPLALVIVFTNGHVGYSMSVPFDRASTRAHLTLTDGTMEEKNEVIEIVAY